MKTFGKESTTLAGLRQWNRVGRTVKAGEKGIMILAPVTVKARELELVRQAGSEQGHRAQPDSDTDRAKVNGRHHDSKRRTAGKNGKGALEDIRHRWEGNTFIVHHRWTQRTPLAPPWQARQQSTQHTMNTTRTISNRLRSYRQQAGLLQSDVAERLGMKSADRISHWEKGVALPSMVNLFKLAVLYQVSPEELYDELWEIVKEEGLRNNNDP